MKIINEQKVIDKFRELIGPRLCDLETEFSEHCVRFSFAMSDVILPKNNPRYLSLKDLNNIANEFNDSEIEFSIGCYRLHMGVMINNEDYYI